MVVVVIYQQPHDMYIVTELTLRPCHEKKTLPTRYYSISWRLRGKLSLPPRLSHALAGIVCIGKYPRHLWVEGGGEAGAGVSITNNTDIIFPVGSQP